MADEKLLPCPHCGHHAYEPDREKARDRYGEWEWVIRRAEFYRQEFAAVGKGARHFTEDLN